MARWQIAVKKSETTKQTKDQNNNKNKNKQNKRKQTQNNRKGWEARRWVGGGVKSK